jgi:glycosyltransferase involved in cell wall biosynthesis
LESLKKQTYPQKLIELIVVDNKSNDRTKEIALGYTRNVFNKGPERSAQRNFGIRKSRGKYVLYLDADMMLNPNVIQDCVERIQQGRNSNLIALHIPERIVSRPVVDSSKPISDYQDSYWIKVRDFERGFYNGTVNDCVRFIEKKAFEKVHGFDETMSGPEDWDLDKKIRGIGRVALTKSPIYHNEGTFDLKRYLAKKSYYSKSFGTYTGKWGPSNPDVKKQLGVPYRMFWVFVEDGKWKKTVMHPLLSVGMFCLRALVGFCLLIGRKS